MNKPIDNEQLPEVELGNNNQTEKDEGEEISYFINDFSCKVFDVLELEKCPNCDGMMENGKCLDINACGYGWGDTKIGIEKIDKARIFDSIKQKKSKNKKNTQDKEKISLGIIDGIETFFYVNLSHINLEKAELQIEYGKIKYKIIVSFNISQHEDFHDDNLHKIILKKSMKIKRHKIGHKIPIETLKKIAFEVLNNARFNKHISIK